MRDWELSSHPGEETVNVKKEMDRVMRSLVKKVYASTKR
jgi:hypothetical protein